MADARIVLLADRGVVAVTGEDALGFLDNLITNDMSLLERQEALHAGLLTPQGKILFEMFVVPRPEGYWLETGREKVPDLIRRLMLYKLRARISVNDLSSNHGVVAAWDGSPPVSPLSIAFADPRAERLGKRLLMPSAMAEKLADNMSAIADYHRHRITLGVPEAGRDYALGDSFPHEADFDIFNGVSFTKGCFVGQEVVARMQHKAVVRKRVVRIGGAGPLAAGADVTLGAATVGSVGSVSGNIGLAMLRLDRIVEAITKGEAVLAGGVPITVDAEALTRYRASVAERAGSNP